MKNNVTLNMDKQDFISFFDEIKNKVFTAQQKAILAVNSELVILYWEIGNGILQNQIREGWGSKVIDSLSKKLNQTFPLMKGFSVRNLKYMRQFASIYADKQFVQEVLAQLSWYNNLTLMQKVKDDEVRNKCIILEKESKCMQ